MNLLKFKLVAASMFAFTMSFSTTTAADPRCVWNCIENFEECLRLQYPRALCDRLNQLCLQDCGVDPTVGSAVGGGDAGRNRRYDILDATPQTTVACRTLFMRLTFR